jgi:hypothetical protein
VWWVKIHLCVQVQYLAGSRATVLIRLEILKNDATSSDDNPRTIIMQTVPFFWNSHFHLIQRDFRMATPTLEEIAASMYELRTYVRPSCIGKKQLLVVKSNITLALERLGNLFSNLILLNVGFVELSTHRKNVNA